MSLALIRGLIRRQTCTNHLYFSCRFNNSSTSTSSNTNPKPPNVKQSSSYSSKTIRQNVAGYVFTKYISYIKNYDKILEKKFPAAMHVYRIFVVGIKDFYYDMKRFMKITRIANTSTQGLRALTRQEIELYHQMPKDMLKVAPVIIISALPLANYVIFPLAYMFPRQLLSPHFWSISQRFEFSVDILVHRIKYNLRVFRFIQAKLSTIKEQKDYDRLKQILGLLGSGLHPTPEEILSVRDIFEKSPYDLDSLPRSHLKHLCGLHGIHKGWRKRMRLAEHAYLVHHMDLAIRREGGVHNLPNDSLMNACHIRGLNTTSMSNDDMIDWLSKWVKVSMLVDGKNISMLLYLPVLITYNHPNNWKLLHRK